MVKSRGHWRRISNKKDIVQLATHERNHNEVVKSEVKTHQKYVHDTSCIMSEFHC